MEPLRQAIDAAQGTIPFADALGIARSLPNMWLARGNVPVNQRPAIERLTGVMVEKFGDEVAWVRIKDRNWPNSAGRPLADYSAAR